MSQPATWTVPEHVPEDRVVDFDFMHPPGAESDVHAAWKALHRGPDIVWSPYNGGHWIATRAEDIETIQKDNLRFSHARVTIPRSDDVTLVPLELDPPEHTAYRTLITPSFLPQAIASMESDVRALTIELIEGFKNKGECEFVGEFAKMLPIVIFLRLVDLPQEDRLHLLEMAELSVRGDLEERQRSQGMLMGYIGKWVQERASNPGNDLISLIVNAKIDGQPISPERMFGMMIVVLFGGLDTVAAMMSFICRFLAEHPAERRRLAEEPELILTAVDELIRRHGVTNTARVVVEDIEFKGVQLKKGDQIQVPNALFGLDERRFANPMEIDLARKPVVHAAFGNGAHRCPGSFLARTEIKVFLQEWLKRIPEFEIKAGEQPRCASGMVNGMLYLPLQWKVA
ncbi:cytochrome P450 [Pseudomonas nicosulfuronedens]|uniref:Cytochrome P450 n=1 Tax=Pseudomonas nicosulfuronedens TaxID=2571105 RepID=A0A5R9QM58_9PSED|nr:cytochrome P450 [Pseudomonas nicosulfuronedens]